jgi:hypothetical protein
MRSTVNKSMSCDLVSLCPTEDMVIDRRPTRPVITVASGTVVVSFYSSTPYTLEVQLALNACAGASVTVLNLALSNVDVNVLWGSVGSGRTPVSVNVSYSRGMTFYFISGRLGWANTALFTVSAPYLRYPRSLRLKDCGGDTYTDGQLQLLQIVNPTWINLAGAKLISMYDDYPSQNLGGPLLVNAPALPQYNNIGMESGNPATIFACPSSGTAVVPPLPPVTIAGSLCLSDPPPTNTFLSTFQFEDNSTIQVTCVQERQEDGVTAFHVTVPAGTSQVGPTYGNYQFNTNSTYFSQPVVVNQYITSNFMTNSFIFSVDLLGFETVNNEIVFLYQFYDTSTPLSPKYVLQPTTAGSSSPFFIGGGGEYSSGPPFTLSFTQNSDGGYSNVPVAQGSRYPNIISFLPPVFSGVSVGTTDLPLIPINVVIANSLGTVTIGGVCTQYTQQSTTYTTTYPYSDSVPPITPTQFFGINHTGMKIDLPLVYFQTSTRIGPILGTPYTGTWTSNNVVSTAGYGYYVEVVMTSTSTGTDFICFQLICHPALPFCVAVENQQPDLLASVQGTANNQLIIQPVVGSGPYTIGFYLDQSPAFIDTVNFFPCDINGNKVTVSPNPIFTVTSVTFYASYPSA